MSQEPQPGWQAQTDFQTPPPGEFLLRHEERGWRMRVALLLADRPGELAEVSSLYGKHGANITFFNYNRSENPYLVLVEATLPDAASAGSLADKLARGGWTDSDLAEIASRHTPLTDPSGLLKIKLTMQDKPGALARAARIMSHHKANIIHMDYDVHAAPGVAELSLATNSPAEIQNLLETLRDKGYHIHVQYRGGESADIEKIIGLSAVEAFLFKLRSILPKDRLAELSDVIASSNELRQTLVDFHHEAGGGGDALATSEVFTSILQLAAASATKTGDNFSLSLTGPVRITDKVRLYMLTCPTGANAYLLDVNKGREYALIDSSYGLYFNDARDWLANHGMNPALIKRAFFTHPDADHAGFAAPLHAQYGTQVFFHPLVKDIFASENRAHGSGSPLEALNGYYTKLINRFTDMRPLSEFSAFSPPEAGDVNNDEGGFRLLGGFEVGDVPFHVLESLGGHVPAQVFFFAPDHGLLFSGDYLIDVPSLSDRAKSTLSLARFLMTSTNTHSRLFAEEMLLLQHLLRENNAALRSKGRRARVFPGHGAFYFVDETEWARLEPS